MRRVILAVASTVVGLVLLLGFKDRQRHQWNTSSCCNRPFHNGHLVVTIDRAIDLFVNIERFNNDG